MVTFLIVVQSPPDFPHQPSQSAALSGCKIYLHIFLFAKFVCKLGFRNNVFIKITFFAGLQQRQLHVFIFHLDWGKVACLWFQEHPISTSGASESSSQPALSWCHIWCLVCDRWTCLLSVWYLNLISYLSHIITYPSLSLWVLICDLTRFSSLRGKATKFRSNKSKGLFYPKFAWKWIIICQGHNHHMERLAEAINFLITKTFTRKDFYLLFAARCILSTFKKLVQNSVFPSGFSSWQSTALFSPIGRPWRSPLVRTTS